jgi:hypothetical protein
LGNIGEAAWHHHRHPTSEHWRFRATGEKRLPIQPYVRSDKGAPLGSYNESDAEQYRQIVTERSEPNHIRMDKKEIKSPKLTAHFLLWIGLLLLAMFALIAHFVWRIF